MSPAVEQRLTQLWESPHTLWGELTTVDHQKLGKRYLATAFAFLIMGGLEALVMRLQLAGPNRSMVDPETYDQLFTMQRQGDDFRRWYSTEKGRPGSGGHRRQRGHGQAGSDGCRSGRRRLLEKSRDGTCGDSRVLLESFRLSA